MDIQLVIINFQIVMVAFSNVVVLVQTRNELQCLVFSVILVDKIISLMGLKYTSNLDVLKV